MPKKKLPQGRRRGSAFAFNYEIIERTVCTEKSIGSGGGLEVGLELELAALSFTSVESSH